MTIDELSTEQRILIEFYRKADDSTKKAVETIIFKSETGATQEEIIQALKEDESISPEIIALYEYSYKEVVECNR